MPAGFQGRTALLIIGFTNSSKKQTSDWSKRVPGDLDTWSIAVLEDVPRLIRGMVTHGIRSDVAKDHVAKDHYDRFLLVWKNEKELKESVEFRQPDDAYLILLSPDGSLKWRYHGAASDAALQQLRELARQVRE